MYFDTFNQVGLTVKNETGGSQQPWVSSSPIDGTFYFVAPAATQVAVAPPQAGRLADTLRPDPDWVPIKDAALLRELSDRLYEHNFDPSDRRKITAVNTAISKFQEKTSMTPTGEPTKKGLLTRLRKMDDLKPWGSIVYGPDSDKWGISWNHPSRRAAVDDARSNCGASKCPIELSFYAGRCGAFAISGKSWSLVQRDTIQQAKTAALHECGKTGKSCRIMARRALTVPAAGIPKPFIRNHLSCQAPSDVGSRLPWSASHSSSRSVQSRQSRNPAAPAVASATTKSRCPAPASTAIGRTRSRPEEESRNGCAAPSRAKRRRGRWRRPFRRRVDCPFRGSDLRRQHRATSHHRRKDHRGTQFRSRRSKWIHDVRRIRLRFELEQFRPFLGPQRLRFIRAFRWMCRTLDRIKTVVANFGSYRVRRSAISQAIPFVCAVSS